MPLYPFRCKSPNCPRIITFNWTYEKYKRKRNKILCVCGSLMERDYRHNFYSNKLVITSPHFENGIRTGLGDDVLNRVRGGGISALEKECEKLGVVPVSESYRKVSDGNDLARMLGEPTKGERKRKFLQGQLKKYQDDLKEIKYHPERYREKRKKMK